VANQYGLSGFGASAVWTPTANSQISATLAQRLGNNPGSDVNGNDSDGRSLRGCDFFTSAPQSARPDAGASLGRSMLNACLD
jgi:hypothetical protein